MDTTKDRHDSCGTAELSLQDRYSAVPWPFRVLSAQGFTIGKFDKLADALAAYNGWAQATAVVIGNYVVCQRKAVRS